MSNHESIQSQVFFQIATTSIDRARSLQGAFPGGRTVHVPVGQVDEDRAKTKDGSPLWLDEALEEVRRISAYKAARDWANIGEVAGALQQLRHQHKPMLPDHTFTDLARTSSDTIQVIFDGDGRVRILHKLVGRELFSLSELLSGRPTAIITALSRIVAPLDGDRAARLETALVMTQYTLRPFGREEFFEFVREETPTKLRGIAGGIPFMKNRFIDTSLPFSVTMHTSSGQKMLLGGYGWDSLNRRQCLDGAFPEVINALLDAPGKPLPQRGVIYAH